MWLVLTLAAVMCLPMLVGARSPAQAAVESTTRVMLVGDSVTHGSSGDWTWRYRLWQHLSRTASVDLVGPRQDVWDNLRNVPGSQDYLVRDFDRDHASYWGGSFAKLVDDRLIADLVTEHRPDVVVEMLGVNDLTWGGEAPSSVLARAREFVAAARSADPGVDVVLAEVPQGWATGAGAFNDGLGRLAAELDSAASRVVLARASSGFRQVADTWDPAHANARGELKLAAAVADALAQVGVGTNYPRPLPSVPLGPRVAPSLSGEEASGALTYLWSGPPGADSHIPLLRDATAGEAWRKPLGEAKLAWDHNGGRWLVGGLVNNHRYQIRLRPVKGYHAAADDRLSRVVTLIPHRRDRFALRVSSPRRGRLLADWPTLRAWRYDVRLRNITRNGRWTVVARSTRDRRVVRRLSPGHRYAVQVVARYTNDVVRSSIGRVRVSR